jgi:hypothetical protein
MRYTLFRLILTFHASRFTVLLRECHTKAAAAAWAIFDPDLPPMGLKYFAAKGEPEAASAMALACPLHKRQKDSFTVAGHHARALIGHHEEHLVSFMEPRGYGNNSAWQREADGIGKHI